MPVDSKSAESKVRSGRSESCNTTNVGTTFIPISIDTDEPIIESHKMPDKLLSSKTEIADSFVATSETSNVIVGDIKLIDVDDASRTKKDTETAKDDIGSIGSPPMISTFPINSFAANETKECDRNHLNDHDAAIDSDQYVNSESYDQMRPEPPTPRWAARLPAHVRLQLTNPAPTRFSNPTAAVYTGSASEVLYKLIAKLLSNPEVDAIIKQELNQLADHIVRICGPLAPYVEKMLTQVFAALTKLQLDIIERIDAACYTDVPLVLMFTAIGSVFGMFVAGQVESGWAISSTTCIMITQVGVWFVILFAIFGASVAMLFNNCIVRGPALVDSS